MGVTVFAVLNAGNVECERGYVSACHLSVTLRVHDGNAEMAGTGNTASFARSDAAQNANMVCTERKYCVYQKKARITTNWLHRHHPAPSLDALSSSLV